MISLTLTEMTIQVTKSFRSNKDASVSIVSDASTPSNGGKWELMHYFHKVSSYLPPLDGGGASDMIEIV